MILLFGAEKGGVGKSTLATNVAAEFARQGADVLLADTDTQPTGSEWAAIRAENEKLAGLTVIQKHGAINHDITKLKDKYDHIIIDAGGGDTREMRSAMLVADLWYIPMTATYADAWTLKKVYENLYEQIITIRPELQAMVVTSMGSTHPKVDDRGTIEGLLQERGYLSESFALSQAVLYRREAYRTAIGMGAAVSELEKGLRDEKAVSELATLFSEITSYAR